MNKYIKKIRRFLIKHNLVLMSVADWWKLYSPDERFELVKRDYPDNYNHIYKSLTEYNKRMDLFEKGLFQKDKAVSEEPKTPEERFKKVWDA